MLTIFTIPKHFTGQNGIRQKNAIQSWLKQKGDNEIILFGDDEGVTEAAREYQIGHCPEIEKNEFGTPLVSSAFEIVRGKAKNDILVFLNADIILVSDIVTAVEAVNRRSYFIMGRRWDLDWRQEIDYQKQNWADELLPEVSRKGKLHGYSGIDYMVFPRELIINMPVFSIGRQGWDNWVLWKVKEMRVPLIDATAMITAIHQNHSYDHSKYGEKNRVGGPETKNNYVLAGGFTKMLSIREADWVLTKKGLILPDMMRRIFAGLNKFGLWRLFLSIIRKIHSL